MSEAFPLDDQPEPSPPSPEVVKVLVDNHRQFLAFLERRLGSRHAAEDVLQDAWVRGLSRLDSVRDEGAVTAWFYRLLRNAIVDHWRRREAERRSLDRLAALPEEHVPAVDEELMNQVCGCVERLLGTLKPEYVEALRRVDLDGEAVADWASAAAITPNNASVRLHRARRALARRLEQSCGTCATHGCLDCTCGGPNAEAAGEC